MTVLQLPADARPREKLLARGACALSDTELLALVLRTGLAGKGVLVLAQELLDRFGGLSGLLRTDGGQLERVKGLGGPAKRSQLLAVLELARRALGEQLSQGDVIASTEAVKHYLQLHLAHRPYEVFAVMFLDAHQRLVAMEEMFRGTLAESTVYPREVVLRALHHRAAGVVLAHNHPSGLVQPSRSDQALTQLLRSALALVDVAVVDHVIVAAGQAHSMAEHGWTG